MTPVAWALALAAAVAVALASLLLVVLTPLPALTNAPIDDGLFVRLGMEVRTSGWLGPFDHLTLAKGMAYPLLLALADMLSVPAKVAEQLVYLAGAAAMGWVAARLAARPALGLLLFVILALDPVWSLDQLMRVRRETMYAGSGLLLVAGVAWLFLVRAEDPRRWRLRDAAVAFLVGLAAGVYWLVREEGIWLVPAVGLIAVVGVARLALRSAQGARLRAVGGVVAGSVALVIGAIVVVGSVLALDSHRYGVALTNDFRDGAFPRAVGAFSRIEEDSPQRYVQVSKADLRAAYAAVPEAAGLEPHLAPRMGRTSGNNCRRAPSSPFVRQRGIEVSCDEVGYAWFPWELRAAISDAGHWGDGPSSQAFLDRLANGIDAACEDGLLRCGPPIVSTSPPVSTADVREAVGLMPTAFRVLSTSNGPLGGAASVGSEEALRACAGFLNGPLALVELGPPEGRRHLRVTGFVAGLEGTPDVRVERPPEASFILELDRRPDPRLTAAFAPEVAAAIPQDTWTGGLRFSLETDCLTPDCTLVVDHGNGAQSTMLLADLREGRVEMDDGTILRIAEATEVGPEPSPLAALGTARDETVLALQRWLDGLYGAVLPWLSLLGLVGCVAALVVPSVRRRSFLLGTLTVACGVAVLARFGIIGLLEVAAWPGAMSIAKLAPASPFLITFAVLGTFLLGRSVVAVMRGLADRRRGQAGFGNLSGTAPARG